MGLLLALGCSPLVVAFGGPPVATPAEIDLGVVFVDLPVEVPILLSGGYGVPLDVAFATGPGLDFAGADTATPGGEPYVLTVTARTPGPMEGVLRLLGPDGEVALVVPARALAQYDVDGDGYGSADTGGDDCDDQQVSVHPGAEDTWYDGLDADCNGDDDFDQDGDGVPLSADCDDTDPHRAASAPEQFNGLDDDCDGRPDDLEIGDVADARITGGRYDALGLPGMVAYLPGDEPRLLVASLGGDSDGLLWSVAARDIPGAWAEISTVAGSVVYAPEGLALGVLQATQSDWAGDDRADLVVGAAVNVGDDGGVWVVDGGRALEGSLDDIATFEVRGDSELDATRVGAVADLDGDGQNELIVGSASDQHYTGDETLFDVGNVAVFRGDQERDDATLSDADFQIHGARERSYLGWSLIAEDIDSDGYADILASAPWDNAGGTDAGAVFLFPGVPDLDYAESAMDAASATWVGSEDGAYLGLWGISAPGDNDGDGLPDLLFAEPSVDLVTWWPGGRSVEGLHNTRDGAAGWAFSAESHAACGSSVLGNVDLDGDLRDDVLVGCPFASAKGHLAGQVVRVDPDVRGIATEGFELGTIDGTVGGANLGFLLWGGVDLTGDGREDVIAGAPGDNSGGQVGAGALFLLAPLVVD